MQASQQTTQRVEKGLTELPKERMSFSAQKTLKREKQAKSTRE
jgi:hypothetical protein